MANLAALLAKAKDAIFSNEPIIKYNPNSANLLDTFHVNPERVMNAAMDVGSLGGGMKLFRGVRSSGGVLGGEGGRWFTTNPKLAKTFGKTIEETDVPAENLVKNIDPVSAANYFRRAVDKIDDVADMTKDDWDKIRKYWKSKGKKGINFGSMHMDDADDIWLFD